MTLCGLARDTVLSNRQTRKLNFDTNYIIIQFVTQARLLNTQSAGGNGPILEKELVDYLFTSLFDVRTRKTSSATMVVAGLGPGLSVFESPNFAQS